MAFSRRIRVFLAAAVVVGALPAGAVLAQPAPANPMAQPADFAAVRAKFEGMTPAQVQAAGYTIPAPQCVSSPMGGMGYHAINFRLHQQQFRSGGMDPQNPPVLLIGGDGRVIGLEWETNQNAAAPVLFGQTVRVLPGHPGLEEPHYMLHAYFRPNGQVLFADFDPEVTCPAPGTWPTGFAAPTAAAAPTQLPRAGAPAPSLGLGALAGLGAIGAAWALRRPRS